MPGHQADYRFIRVKVFYWADEIDIAKHYRQQDEKTDN